MYALAEQNKICFEKMVLKLGILILAMAVFSGQNLSISAYTAGVLLEGHIVKEQSNALFLLRKNFETEILEKYKGNTVREIENGVFYTRINKIIGKRKIKINVVEINREINPNIRIEPQLATETIHSKGKINKIAKNSIVAVNGTYFKQTTGTPLGALVINNEIITGPMYNRVALGIGKKGFKTERLSFNGYLKNKKQEINIDNINQPRMIYSQVLIYTNKWGEKSPEMKSECMQIAIKNNKIVATSPYPLIIPDDGVVISAPMNKLEGFELGDKVDFEYSIIPKWNDTKHIISGGPYLMKQGEIFIDTEAQKLKSISGRNPRTAIGYTKDNIMIIITVDGRKEGTSGVTLNELAQIMEELNCYEAINLDGGSSTVMYVNGNILSGSNIKSAMISNALVIKLGENS